MKHSVYCRRLEDWSGFGIFQKQDPLSKWEVVFGVGPTRKLAWKNYRAARPTETTQEPK